MNFKACTFESLALIFGFGRGAQVGKTSLLEVNLYGASVNVGRTHFLFGTLQALEYHQNLRFWKKTKLFLTMRSQVIVRRQLSRQRSGVVSQQCLHPRRFDSTVKRVSKLTFEPVSFLFLACL